MADEGGKERRSGRYGESSLGNCPERTKHGRRTEDRRQSKRPHTADDVDDDQAMTGWSFHRQDALPNEDPLSTARALRGSEINYLIQEIVNH